MCLIWKNVHSAPQPSFYSHYLFSSCWLACMSSLYFLDTNVWTVIWFANIFFHSTSCLFVLRSFPSLCRSFVVKFSVFYSCFCFPWLGSCNYKNIAKADITDRFFWNFMFSVLNKDEYMYSLWESSILILSKRGGFNLMECARMKILDIIIWVYIYIAGEVAGPNVATLRSS